MIQRINAVYVIILKPSKEISVIAYALASGGGQNPESRNPDRSKSRQSKSRMGQNPDRSESRIGRKCTFHRQVYRKQTLKFLKPMAEQAVTPHMVGKMNAMSKGTEKKGNKQSSDTSAE
ncbi:hypothetical protein M513_11100 [Trichuris suis]|uniref:Uncharacterized protein n=1 Tax=Trichuris suis TaxID=68888 RepID=A0A085LSS2_9BILA|nr:hypothetical protein M513_11100 [Trichuris suis]